MDCWSLHSSRRPSYFASAEYPVRSGFSSPSLIPRNTGSPAFADDDGSDSHFKQQRIYKHSFAISPRLSREFCFEVPPPEIRGRRECRVPNAPAASCVIKNTRVSHHRYTGNHPAFPAQWFYGLLRALPGDQACLTPSPALLIADLTPASGRQNHTTSPYASASFVRPAFARLTLPRPPHPAPRS